MKIYVSKFEILDDISDYAEKQSLDTFFVRSLVDMFTYSDDDTADIFKAEIVMFSSGDTTAKHEDVYFSRIVNNGETHIITLSEKVMKAIYDGEYEAYYLNLGPHRVDKTDDEFAFTPKI